MVREYKKGGTERLRNLLRLWYAINFYVDDLLNVRNKKFALVNVTELSRVANVERDLVYAVLDMIKARRHGKVGKQQWYEVPDNLHELTVFAAKDEWIKFQKNKRPFKTTEYRRLLGEYQMGLGVLHKERNVFIKKSNDAVIDLHNKYAPLLRAALI